MENMLALAITSFFFWLAAAYELNDVEKKAMDCIRAGYEDSETKVGKLQISCRERNGQAEFEGIWLPSGKLEGAFNRLPLFREEGKCDQKINDPFYHSEAVLCARKLMEAHCDSVSTQTREGKNIEELLQTLKPRRNVCSSSYVPSELENAAIRCIYHAFLSLDVRNGASISCLNGEFIRMIVDIGAVVKKGLVTANQLWAICKDRLISGKAIRCAAAILEQVCGKSTTRSRDKSAEKALIEMVLPKARVCENEN